MALDAGNPNGGAAGNPNPAPGASGESLPTSSGGSNVVDLSTSDPGISASDGGAGTPAPVSSQDIVRQVTESLAKGEPVGGVEPAVEAKVEPSAEEKAAAEAKAKADDPYGLGEMHYIDQQGVQREHRIPKPRVKEMISKAVEGEHSTLKKAFNLRDDLKITPEILTTIGSDFAALRGEAKSFSAAMDLIQTNPSEFVDRMLAVNPRAEEVLRQRFGGTAPVGAGAAAAGKAGPVAAGEMPKPNVRLADGSMTYDIDGLKALLDWNTKATREAVNQDIESRLGPAEREAKARAADEAKARAEKDLSAKVDAMFEEAMSWPGFAENQVPILEWLEKNPGRTLNNAYMALLGPKWATDRQKVREEVAAEFKKAPKSTATGSADGTSSRVNEAAGPVTNQSIVADVIAGKRR